MNEDIIITPAATFRALTRIEAKQDAILNGHEALKGDMSKLDKRMTTVETRQNKVAGILTAVVFFITFFGQKIREVLIG